MSIFQLFDQCFPPKPAYTADKVSDLSDKVFIVTGGASGIGFELTKLLYSKSGTVYIAGRSSSNAKTAIQTIKSSIPSSPGRLEYLPLDLSDLSGIKAAAQTFLSNESRLDVIWHNAGVMTPAWGSKTKQGHELQLGTHVLGPWLLQYFLTPLMATTASRPDTSNGSVRAVWVSSLGMVMSPTGGINWDDLNYDNVGSWSISRYLACWQSYGQSKAAATIIAAQAARQWQDLGILSVAVNPGNLNTQLSRHQHWLMRTLMSWILPSAYYGALTELYAGLSSNVDESTYVIPWGRIGKSHIRKDLVECMENEDGNSSRLWQWCWDEAKEHM